MTKQKITQKCVVENCNDNSRVRSMCGVHYQRWRRHGNPSIILQHTVAGKTLEERFTQLVNKTPGLGRDGDCWEWIRKGLSHGYGALTFRKRKYFAHRLAWELANGCSVQEGLMILHSCDNTICVNPAHLREGTQPDNVHDMCERNRNVRGKKVTPKALEADVVRRIRKALQTGLSVVQVARNELVADKCVSSIKNNRYYKWVT